MPFRYLFPDPNDDLAPRVIAIVPAAVCTPSPTEAILEVVVSDADHATLDRQLPAPPFEYGPVDAVESHLTVAIMATDLERIRAAATKGEVDKILAAVVGVG